MPGPHTIHTDELGHTGGVTKVTMASTRAIEDRIGHFTDTLQASRVLALELAIVQARHYTAAAGRHPGTEAVLEAAGKFHDFVWNGGAT